MRASSQKVKNEKKIEALLYPRKFIESQLGVNPDNESVCEWSQRLMNRLRNGRTSQINPKLFYIYLPGR